MKNCIITKRDSKFKRQVKKSIYYIFLYSIILNRFILIFFQVYSLTTDGFLSLKFLFLMSVCSSFLQSLIIDDCWSFYIMCLDVVLWVYCTSVLPLLKKMFLSDSDFCIVNIFSKYTSQSQFKSCVPHPEESSPGLAHVTSRWRVKYTLSSCLIWKNLYL